MEAIVDQVTQIISTSNRWIWSRCSSRRGTGMTSASPINAKEAAGPAVRDSGLDISEQLALETATVIGNASAELIGLS